MTFSFPSPEFDDVVTAVCHGSATEAEMRALNALLRSNPSARDEYLMRIELHTRLASQPELFSQVTDGAASCPLPDSKAEIQQSILPLSPPVPARRRKLAPILALAASVMFIAGGVWGLWFKGSTSRNAATSTAVAMLTRTVDAEWDQGTEPLRVGAALKPGIVRLKSGLAQVVF